MEPPSPFDSSSSELSETTCRPTSPFTHDPEPKLGIAHLLGWTGFTAAFLGLQQLLLNSMPGIPDSPGYAISRVAWGLGAGIAVGSLLMMTLRRWRRISFPAHPGEFLLVLHGLAIVVTFATWGAIIATVGFGDSWAMMTIMILPQFAVVIFTAIWAWQNLSQRHWRRFFISFAVFTMLLIAVQFVFPPLFWSPAWVLNAIRLALAGLLAYAVLGDRRTGERRPWTHWLGIALQAWLWFTEWILPMLVPLT